MCMKYDVSMGDEQKREMIYTRKQNIICECVIYKNVYYTYRIYEVQKH